MAELAEMVRSTVAPGAIIEVRPTDDLRSYHVSAETARRELGFLPKYSLTDAIRDVADAIDSGMVHRTTDERFFNIQVMKRALLNPGQYLA